MSDDLEQEGVTVEIEIPDGDSGESASDPASGLETDLSAGLVQAAATADAEEAEATADEALDTAEDAIEIASETLVEVRALREEMDEEWRAEIKANLNSINQQLDRILDAVQLPELSTAETLEIEEPEMPEEAADDGPAPRRRGKKWTW